MSVAYKRLRAYDKDFTRACVKGLLGKTTRYLGTTEQALASGLVKPMLAPSKVMTTEKTIRTCRRCRGGHNVIIENINGLLTEQKCLICGGAGVVYN